MLNDIADDALARVVDELRALGRAGAVAVVADVGSREAGGAVGRAGRRLAVGGVDVLVNNAGWSVPVSHLLEMTEEHWDDVHAHQPQKHVPVHADVRRAHMVERTASRAPIVCLSSFGATRAHRSMAAYDASKGGVEAFTRAAALDLAPFGVRVNAIGPGAIHTEYLRPRGHARPRQRARPVPLRRVGMSRTSPAAWPSWHRPKPPTSPARCLYIDGGMHAQLRPPQIDIPIPEHLQRHIANEADGAYNKKGGMSWI